MPLTYNTNGVSTNVNKKDSNQTHFLHMKGDVRGIWTVVRPGIKGKWGDGPLFQSLKKIFAMLEAIFAEVRVGKKGKYHDGPLASLVRSSRNDVRSDIAELSAKVDALSAKIK